MVIQKDQRGFTIVELLIVIVVIGILAAITVVAFNGIQQRARDTKIKSDISQLTRAITAARVSSGKNLGEITAISGATADPCWQKPNGTDIAALPKTDGCWTTYTASLAAISTAGGVNVRNLLDPWGRPYLIYEQEGKTGDPCDEDWIGNSPLPFQNYGVNNLTRIPRSAAITC